jgi:hypothetical protein
MAKMIKSLFLLTLVLSVKCQKSSESTDTVNNSRLTKVVEMHSQNIRQYFCREKGLTQQQWTNIKSGCINPRINELIPVRV